MNTVTTYNNIHDYSSVHTNSNIIDATHLFTQNNLREELKPKPPKQNYTDKNGHIPVQPIIGEDIQRVKTYILNRPQRYYKTNINFNLRDYTLFCFNINIGLRISDLLKLKISDVLINGHIPDSIVRNEGKNKKNRELFFVPEIKEILMQYINSMDGWEPDWYLFHAVWPKRTPYKQLRRETVWHQMKNIEEEIDSKVPLGTHSLRKTFARALYDMLSPIDPMAILVIQDMLGHSSPEITLAYIGITREKKIDLRMRCGMI